LGIRSLLGWYVARGGVLMVLVVAQTRMLLQMARQREKELRWRMDSILPNIQEVYYKKNDSCYPALAMSHGTPLKEKEIDRARLISRHEECDV
jgi:hypothetical protein